jgi:hypothetical protein
MLSVAMVAAPQLNHAQVARRQNMRMWFSVAMCAALLGLAALPWVLALHDGSHFGPRQSLSGRSGHARSCGFEGVDAISDEMRAVVGVKSYPASSRNA